jgi:hypothetical protein
MCRHPTRASLYPREPPEAASLYPREPRAGLLIYLRNLQKFITPRMRMDLALRREYEPIKLRINFTLKHKFMNVLNI